VGCQSNIGVHFCVIQPEVGCVRKSTVSSHFYHFSMMSFSLIAVIDKYRIHYLVFALLSGQLCEKQRKWRQKRKRLWNINKCNIFVMEHRMLLNSIFMAGVSADFSTASHWYNIW